MSRPGSSMARRDEPKSKSTGSGPASLARAPRCLRRPRSPRSRSRLSQRIAIRGRGGGTLAGAPTPTASRNASLAVVTVGGALAGARTQTAKSQRIAIRSRGGGGPVCGFVGGGSRWARSVERGASSVVSDLPRGTVPNPQAPRLRSVPWNWLLNGHSIPHPTVHSQRAWGFGRSYDIRIPTPSKKAAVRGFRNTSASGSDIVASRNLCLMRRARPDRPLFGRMGPAPPLQGTPSPRPVTCSAPATRSNRRPRPPQSPPPTPTALTQP